MDRDALQDLLSTTFAEVGKLNDSKGREYATNQDALANFYRRAGDVGISPMQVWAVFFGKHVDAVMSYVRTGEVLSEPIEGRIHDAILYLVLLAALIKDQSW